MNKNIKALIACGAVLVIAGGGYAALMLTGENENSSLSSSNEPIATTHEMILNIEKTDITAVSSQNSGGGFEAEATGKTNDEGTPTLSVKGLDGLTQNDTILLSLMNNASQLSSDSVVSETADDLDKFGLKNPQATVTIKAKSGNKTLLIGDESPQSGETYCMTKGSGESDNKVYLVGTSAVSVFLNQKENFLDLSLIPQSEDGSDQTAEKIKISRDDLDYDIVLEEDKVTSSTGNKTGTMATHIMTEPVFSYLDVEKSQDTLQGFFGLTAYSALYAHPTEEQLKGSQLDKPLGTVEMNVKGGKSYTIKIGKSLDIADGKFYAVMINDIDAIYAVDAEKLVWATLTPGDITSKMIFGTYVWDIGRLKIDVNGGETVEFTGSGKDESSYEVSKNGEKCDAARFKQFYQFLLKTSAEEFDISEKPDGDAEVAILLETQDGSVSQTVEFYKAEGKKCLIVVNGVPCFKCRSAYVDLLKANLAKFDSSEEFVMNW